MKLKNFVAKYQNASVEDDITVMSKEAKKFVSDFRNMLRTEMGDGYSIEIKPGHYDLSGYVTEESSGHILYVSYSIARYGGSIDLTRSDTMNGVLYRASEKKGGSRDGHNRFCSVCGLPDCLRELFESYNRFGKEYVGLR